jgi:radical SAM protein with 4Fe4S-binding SPASM domain
MSVETFTKILEQIKPHTKHIYLHVKGEPLLHPELDKLLDISYEKGFKVNITTNGTLIHMVGGMLLTKPGVRQINFSLHSISGNKEFNDEETYVNNILSFIKEAMEKSEMFISLRFWNLDNTVQSETRKNNNILEHIESDFDLPYKIQEAQGLERGIEIANRVYINQARQFTWPSLDENKYSSCGFCYGLRNQAAILVDGTVVPCCLDGEGVINLGNINSTAFSDIIQSQRANNIAHGFLNKRVVEELCLKCEYRRRFI